MSRTRILQVGPLLPELDKRLGEHFDVHALYLENDRDAFLAANGPSFEGIATSARYGANAALIDALPNVRVISSFGVGLDTIDLGHAKARGIQIGYTPDVLNDCVADTAFALLLDAARRFSESDRYLRAGKWAKAPFPMSTKVSGKRLGILGLGRIGKVVAKRASGFDMEVRYHNRRKDPAVPYAYMDTLKGLAEWADFLVVVSAGGPETRHLVSAEILAALGPGGFVINVARGSVIDQEALVKALQDGTIAGAGLDVYDNEPNISPVLFGLDNAVLLPHLASGTHETRAAMAALTFDNLSEFFSTGRVKVAA